MHARKLVARMRNLLYLRAKARMGRDQILDALECRIRLEKNHIRLPAPLGIVDELHQLRCRHPPRRRFQTKHPPTRLHQSHQRRSIRRALFRNRRINRQHHHTPLTVIAGVLRLPLSPPFLKPRRTTPPPPHPPPPVLAGAPRAPPPPGGGGGGGGGGSARDRL